MTIFGAADAHEFWIEPSAHYTETPQRVDILLKVGQYFRGTAQPYLAHKFERFEHISTAAEPVEGLLGDSRPAAGIVTRPGLNQLVHLTTPSTIRFRPGDERWGNYVAEDALEGQLRKFPDLPQTPPLVERYVRAAKSLVVTGADAVADSRSGVLPFELVIDGNWSRLRPGEHRFTLFEEENGLAGILVKAFRHADRKVVDQAYTDAAGQVALTLPSADRYLVSGVVIRPGTSARYDWISYWPSLTLEVR